METAAGRLNPVKVDVGQVKRVVSRLLDAVIESNGNDIELLEDEYWCILGRERFEIYEQPGELGVGQLSDVVAEVVAGDSDPSRLSSLDLIRVGELLVALGDLLEQPLRMS